ncbi:hypothetical protein Q428_00910 [Fervidicella metallireducens AeB]|uniref:Bypass of forespore C C-terminal domain-containing protein n=1 Tax=Fervidicella metallireducens AeB TaxID=1403537 RepID=A0A017S0K1_9CLOT|nr:hypothetical protein [Fervidicella metallireducens]EYE89710.1 hypothetical protein Q428_00910 [Fervidicella metallireducens AeB]
MYIRKLYLILILLITFMASFATGYFMVEKYVGSSIKNKSYNLEKQPNVVTAKSSSNNNIDAVINSNTKIVRFISYRRGVEYEVPKVEKPNEELLGMNFELASEYFKKDGYVISSFTSDQVTVKRYIDDVWPPNTYLMIAEDGLVKCYKIDENSKPIFLEEVEIEFEVQPEDVQTELKRGKIFENQEKLEEYIANIDS